METYYITRFDDGLSTYINYPNIWIITGERLGKYELVNKIDSNITIASISAWKLSKY